MAFERNTTELINDIKSRSSSQKGLIDNFSCLNKRKEHINTLIEKFDTQTDNEALYFASYIYSTIAHHLTDTERENYSQLIRARVSPTSKYCLNIYENIGVRQLNTLL